MNEDSPIVATLKMLDFEMSLNEELNPNLIRMWRLTIQNLIEKVEESEAFFRWETRGE